MHLIPGSAFGRYVIEARLGEGSLGVVYLASDPTLGRRVALKLLSPELAGDPDFRLRFVTDARSTAALDHPHVLPVYEAGERDGQLYLATRYVPGRDLRTLIARDGALSIQRAGLFLAQIASALDAAHASGLVHGNVNPSNVLIAVDEHAYLADFGVTAPPDSNRSATHSAQPEVAYLAPELLSGTPASPRSDIYALGCTFVECLTGTPPRRDTQRAPQGHGPGPATSTRRTDLPTALEPVIARALAERAEDRYATATEFAVAAAGASGLPAATRRNPPSSYTGPHPPDTTRQIGSLQRKRLARLLLASALGLTAFGTTAIAYVTYGSNLFSALTPSRAPTTSFASSPTTIALAHIGLRAEELMLPLSEFPFTGYTVPRDQAADATRWIRRYRAGTTLAAPFYDSALQVWSKADEAEASLGAWITSCTTARPTPLGESSRGCVKREVAPAVSSITLLLIVRNVSVVLTASPSVLASDDDAEMRLGELVAIGRAQRAWIDRIAPEDGSTPTRPVPVPTPRVVGLPNEQIVLPLADFPLRGYSMGPNGVNSDSWYREFISSKTRAVYANQSVVLRVYVALSAVEAESRFTTASRCDSGERLATSIGDHVIACVFGAPSARLRGVRLAAVWRNVYVLLDSDIDNEPVDVRIEELATVIRSQFTVIDRVAPP